MAYDYAALRDSLVVPKIREYGRPITLRRPGTAAGWTKTYNAAQGRWQWKNNTTHVIVYVDPAATPVDVAGYGIEVKYEQAEIDGTTVLSNDRRIKTIDIPRPTTADKLIVNGTSLTIVNVMPTEPGGVAVIYTLQCRA